MIKWIVWQLNVVFVWSDKYHALHPILIATRATKATFVTLYETMDRFEMSGMSNTPHQKASVYELRRSVSFALHLIGVANVRIVCMGECKNASINSFNVIFSSLLFKASSIVDLKFAYRLSGRIIFTAHCVPRTGVHS